jgi:hypothetical protein
MLSSIVTTAGWVLALAVAASPVTKSKTCEKLDTAYRASLDVTVDARRHYQQCVSQRAARSACEPESFDFRAAQEELEASFSSYAKTCGSTVVQSGRRDSEALALRSAIRGGT